MNEAIDVRKEYERWLDENYLAEFPRDPLHPNKVSYFWEAYKAGIQHGRELEMEELSKQKPVGYVRAYAVKCLQGTLMNDTLGIIPPPSSTRIGPYQEAADDIPLYAKPIP